MLELKIDRINKIYGRKTVVDNVSLTFTNGVYGLLGANGAGKTTLLRMICNVLYPSSGEILVNGQEIRKMGGEYRRLLGYLPQDFGYYPDFTVRKYMMYLSSLKAVPKSVACGKVEELLELVSLTEQKTKKIRTLSGGMIRRLGIAQAMLNDPEILILDEPTSGLDPKERIRFRNIISSLSKDRIVLLSTHIVSDIEYIADEILMMKSGSIIRKGTMDTIAGTVEGKVWECVVEQKEIEEYTVRYAVVNMKNEEGKVRLRLLSDARPAPEAVSIAPTMEDVYLYYFQEEGIIHENLSI